MFLVSPQCHPTPCGVCTHSSGVLMACFYGNLLLYIAILNLPLVTGQALLYHIQISNHGSSQFCLHPVLIQNVLN